MLAIELNDAEIVARDGAEERLCESGIARLDCAPWKFGAEAERGWRLQPLAVSSRHFAAIEARDPGARYGAADIVYAQMRRWRESLGGAPVALLVSGAWTPEQLGLLLAVAQAAGLAVAGLADTAVCAAAALPYEGNVLHVDVELERGVVTAIDAHADRCECRQVIVLPELGWRSLREGWLRGFAARMVRERRFDPLHSAPLEQALYDAMSGWLERLTSEPRISPASLESEGESYAIDWSAEQVLEDAEGAYGALRNALHSLRRAGQGGAILISHAAQRLPGLASVLDDFPDCELFHAERGLAAAMYPQVADQPFKAASPALLRSVKRRPQPALLPVRAARPAREHDADPTHLVFEGRVLPLGAAPLLIGTEPRGEHALRVGEGAGISRNHCLVAVDAGGVYVLDLSRYGTFLNRERVAGRALLRAGDTLELGGLGKPLSLVRMS